MLRRPLTPLTVTVAAQRHREEATAPSGRKLRHKYTQTSSPLRATSLSNASKPYTTGLISREVQARHYKLSLHEAPVQTAGVEITMNSRTVASAIKCIGKLIADANGSSRRGKFSHVFLIRPACLPTYLTYLPACLPA